LTVARAIRLDGDVATRVLAGLLAEGLAVRLTVHGGSMSPWIRDGDVLTIVPREGAGDPRPGDVVAFRRPGGERLVVHRLVSRAPGGWIAHGDRCSAPDGFVAGSEVLGTVERVTRGTRRRLLPQGLLGLALSTSSRIVLQARDRFRASSAADTAAREDRA
jgi:hypothetical protein